MVSKWTSYRRQHWCRHDNELVLTLKCFRRSLVVVIMTHEQPEREENGLSQHTRFLGLSYERDYRFVRLRHRDKSFKRPQTTAIIPARTCRRHTIVPSERHDCRDELAHREHSVNYPQQSSPEIRKMKLEFAHRHQRNRLWKKVTSFVCCRSTMNKQFLKCFTKKITASDRSGITTKAETKKVMPS